MRKQTHQGAREQKRRTVRNCLMACSIAAARFVSADTTDETLHWDIVVLERTRIEKQICDERHPEFKDRNGAAFRSSPFHQVTAEELIKSKATGELREKLLGFLPEYRASVRDDYSAKPERVRWVCANFASDVEKATRDATVELRKK